MSTPPAHTIDRANTPSALKRVLWRIVGRPVFRFSLHNAYRFRCKLLSLFGADVHPKAMVRRTCTIEHPWNLTMGEAAIIGDEACLSGRGSIRLGDRATVSQLAQLATTRLVRDEQSGSVRAHTADVVIEDDAWVAADSLVLPGVTVRAEALIGARSLVDRDAQAGMISAGHPASPRRERGLRRLAHANQSQPGGAAA